MDHGSLLAHAHHIEAVQNVLSAFVDLCEMYEYSRPFHNKRFLYKLIRLSMSRVVTVVMVRKF